MEARESNPCWLNGMVPHEVLAIDFEGSARATAAAHFIVTIGVNKHGQLHWLWDAYAYPQP